MLHSWQEPQREMWVALRHTTATNLDSEYILQMSVDIKTHCHSAALTNASQFLHSQHGHQVGWWMRDGRVCSSSASPLTRLREIPGHLRLPG